MKFDEWWNKEVKHLALDFRVRGDVQIGWNAALEYGGEKTSTNKQNMSCPKCKSDSVVSIGYSWGCDDCGNKW